MPYQQFHFHKTDLTNKRVLITGGGGFIGSHVAEYLLTHRVGFLRVLDNFETGAKENLAFATKSDSFEVIEGDIRNYDACVKALEGIDYVLHLAALGSVPRSVNDPLTTHATNVTGFLNVLQAAKNRGVKGFVYASSSSVYGDTTHLPWKEGHEGNVLSPYALSKQTNEAYAAVYHRCYAFPSVGLRFFNVFGPRQNPEGAYAAVIPRFFKAAFTEARPVIFGDGSVSRDFTHVVNVVQVCVAALLYRATGAHVVNVGCGQSTSVLRLWELIRELTGATAMPEFLPPRKGDIHNSMADLENVTRLLSYAPVVDLAQGLQLTATFYRNLFSKS